MKTKKSIIIALCILGYSFCNAQVDYIIPSLSAQRETHENEIKTMPYIFEATVIKQIRKNGELCNIMQITKIYKGSPQLKIGTIKVLSGEVGGFDGILGLSMGGGNIVGSILFLVNQKTQRYLIQL